METNEIIKFVSDGFDRAKAGAATSGTGLNKTEDLDTMLQRTRASRTITAGPGGFVPGHQQKMHPSVFCHYQNHCLNEELFKNFFYFALQLSTEATIEHTWPSVWNLFITL